MKRNGINLFASERDKEAAVAKRFNRTMKTRILTYLLYKGTVREVEIIQYIVRAIINSYHTTIGMPLMQVLKNINRLSI